MAAAEPSTDAPSVAICTGCGAIAPGSRTACEVCSAALGAEPTTAPAGIGTASWVRVQACHALCPSCGARAPVAGLVSSVGCEQCSRIAPLPPPSWESLFVTARRWSAAVRATADDRNADEHVWSAGVTVARWTTQTSFSSAANLELAVSVGHPLCPACKGLIDAELEGSELAVRCRRCGAKARYAITESVRRSMPAAIAAIAESHRIDRPVGEAAREARAEAFWLLVDTPVAAPVRRRAEGRGGGFQVSRSAVSIGVAAAIVLVVLLGVVGIAVSVLDARTTTAPQRNGP